MSTTSRPSPPGRRAGSPSTNLAKGTTARAAISSSPRTPSTLNSTARRPTSSRSSSNDLSSQLKQETEQKESLLVQLQDKDSTIQTLSSENDTLTSALRSAEARINELYTDQSRSESEMATRIEISEKLREQIQSLEKESRDLQRRYNEQTKTFDSERQAFYDSEQHLKSRIQHLSQTRKQAMEAPTSAGTADDVDLAEEEEEDSSSKPEPETESKQDVNDPETEPAEMTALKLELSTLSTSYTSMQSTLVLLQSQLNDLKRVNAELQEENESYMILLREKTLSGQYNVMKQVGAGSDEDEDGDVGSLRSTARSTLDPVDEEVPESLGDELSRSLDPDEVDGHLSATRRSSASTSPALKGESLADLPITGPGLDLAAELGRAENRDILEGNIVEDRDRSVLNGKGRIGKKGSDSRKISAGRIKESGLGSTDLDALRTEVKSLKDANKALSLYASKIIDRIIAQEGFEHVLAVDYDKEPTTPATAGPVMDHSNQPSTPTTSKPRPQSVIGPSSTSSILSPQLNASPQKLGAPPAKTSKPQRRSLSFDWRGFSIFSGAEKKPDPNLRPLTLKPGGSSVTGGRKLDTEEDEEDRKERDRLDATMKLMGIQPPPRSPGPQSPAMQKAVSSPAPPTAATPSANPNRRFSLFSKATTAEPAESSPSANLTQDALEHAEVESSLAALDSHEKTLSAEIAKGSGSGFTEIQPRVGGRRSRRSAGGSGSGSTVWSAGMSGAGDDD